MDYKSASMEPHKHTTDPIVTGTSVVGIKYQGGILLMADTLGSYGSLARFKNLRRIRKVNEHTVIGGGGEYSDFQFIMDLLEKYTTEDFEHDDGHKLTPQEIHSVLTRIMYNRRSRVNPLWNSLVIAGRKEGKSFLGFVDLYGTSFEDNFLATGYGNYLAIPLLRARWKPDMTYDEAKQLLDDCMRVLSYRDCRTINKFTMSRIDDAGIFISEPFSLQTEWEYKLFVNPDKQA